MPVTEDEIERHHNELRAEFGGGGIIGPNLYPIHALEEGYEAFVCNRFKGYRLVHQCFISFFLDSLKLGEMATARLPATQEWAWYRPLLVFGANIFSRVRSTEILYLHGYPLDGYALLRDLKDRAIYLAAVLSGLTKLPAILGMEALAEEANEKDFWESGKRMAALRKKEQRKILGHFTGPSSNLPAPLDEDLRRWEVLFDEEVHLSIKTFFLEGGPWLNGLRNLPAGPHQHEFALSMYMNRSAEVSWCLLRTLPVFQPEPDAFGPEWSRRWQLLEDNLRLLVSSR